jgi:hypothetical protein
MAGEVENGRRSHPTRLASTIALSAGALWLPIRVEPQASHRLTHGATLREECVVLSPPQLAHHYTQHNHFGPSISSVLPEAEYAALFAGAQQAASLRTILSDLGYPQPPTISIMCDNTCVIGIATDSIKQKRSKGTDMRFHWV